MRILIVKMSSMGDIIHTLPALTDAGLAIPGITFDWVVEEHFAEIPRWHPLVNQVIPVALRRWRKSFAKPKTWQEWVTFRNTVRATKYDFIIDAQGLLKSALVAWNARGKRRGFNKQSARESWAALFYQQTFFVAKKQHAISRLRQLFSQILGYRVPTTIPDYGIDRAFKVNNSDPYRLCGTYTPFRLNAEPLIKIVDTLDSVDRQWIETVNIAEDVPDPCENYLVFLHGTTWKTKHWPESAWIELVKMATDDGWTVKLPWGNRIEKERAQRMAAVSSRAVVLSQQSLRGLANILSGAKAVVAVDTGLLHLTAALGVPAVSLYGPTNPILSGALGKSQKNLAVTFPCAPCLRRECLYPYALSPPCFSTLSPAVVWSELATCLSLSY